MTYDLAGCLAHLRRKEMLYAILGDTRMQWETQRRYELIEELEALPVDG